MIRRQPHRRAGFTLLEVLLASIIAVILLGALYVSLSLSLKQMDAARSQAGVSDLTRSIVNRMTTDIASTLGPMPPQSGGASGVASASAAASGSSTSTTSGSTSAPSSTGAGASATGATSTTSTTTGTTSSGSTTTDPTMAAQSTDIPLPIGVIGSDKQLTIFTSRVPSTLVDPMSSIDPSVLQPADLRRVSYYLASSSSGLCRQERPWVTADGVRNSTDPDYSTEDSDMFAPEVVDVTFEYFDGTAWQTEWDGSMPDTDGITPIGPPRAIRITLVFQSPGRGGVKVQKQVQHVFPIRAAIGTFRPVTDSSTTTTSTTTSGGM